jgi:hypothetical protein
MGCATASKVYQPINIFSCEQVMDQLTCEHSRAEGKNQHPPDKLLARFALLAAVFPEFGACSYA